ncbi:radical SAM protein [Candidatus Pacearchaeota archaeon]|nr:radical SAM protein [Candidatus Pacearchaeota archaeon]
MFRSTNPGILSDSSEMKIFRSKNYKYTFNKKTGFFARWGRNSEDDPSFAPFGPEILDIEISTICHGINNKPCLHCYKSNTGTGKNMTFKVFKTILDKMPKVLTQVAFGIGDIDSNPDIWNIFEYTKLKGIVPNVTINGWNITDEYAKNISSLCGAVAISRYEPKDVCYNAVREITNHGMKKVNIHMLLSEETYDKCFELIDDIKTDERLKNLNAVVFLSLKPKGKRNKFTVIKNIEKLKKLIDYAFEKHIKFGFDSCFVPNFLKCIEEHENFKMYDSLSEACESSCFSSYINADGRYFHCSFTEGEKGWEGIDVVNCKDFLKDVWYHPETIKFRNLLINQKHDISKTCRACPIFDLY